MKETAAMRAPRGSKESYPRDVLTAVGHRLRKLSYWHNLAYWTNTHITRHIIL